MASRKLLLGASALLLFSTNSCTALSSTATTSDVSSLLGSSSSAAPSSLIVSSTSTINSSVPPSASATASALSCDGKDAGTTFTHITSKATYDITCGADYPGGDLKFLWTESFDACVVACDEEKGCLTVAFRSGACYLKNQSTQTASDAGIWAAKKHGDKVATSSDEPTCVGKASDATTYKSASGSTFKIVCGKEYGGGDLTSTSVTSFKDCIETCSTTSECIDVSYVNGACYMKRSKSSLIEAGHVWTAELLETATTASTSSIVPTASAATVNELSCTDGKDNEKLYTAVNGGRYVVECGVDYMGNDLNAVDSATFNACIDACDNTEGCVDVSYVWGRCYMKNSAVSSSPAGHVWTGRRTSAPPSDSEIFSSLQQDSGSFCTSYISYKAPVATSLVTVTPTAATVLTVKTEVSTSTNLITSFATGTAVQTLPWLEPRQAMQTPSILSRLPASRISSICSLVATGTSTTASTITASVAPVTLVSTFTKVIPVTKVTATTSFITRSTRLPNPTAAVNLDFETGDTYAWRQTISGNGFSSNMVSPGDTSYNPNSRYAVSMSKEAGSTNAYNFIELQQSVPNLVAGQTYRIEFSWKYDTDVDSDDICSTFVVFWGIGLANLTPSTTSAKLQDTGRHYLATMPQCGTSTNWSLARQTPQSPGVWRRYSTYYRSPYPSSSKIIAYGLHCSGQGVQARKQTVYFDDWVITPVAAC